MDRRRFVLTLLAGMPAVPSQLRAQPAAKIYRVGLILTVAHGDNDHIVRAFEQGLRDLGYVEGLNLELVRRFAEGSQERLPALAAELVRLKVDVIVTGSSHVIEAVKQATITIPVVMVVAQDPMTLSSRSRVVMLAARRRLPAMYALKEFPDVGGLMSYGPNVADPFRRAAAYVDKILKGAKLTIPPSLLALEQIG